MIVPNLVPTAILHKDYAGLEAIDGFLATQLCQSLGSQNAIMQHLIMALSRALRNGHSCLPLADIAGQTLWSAVSDIRTGTGAAPGYTFDAFSVLMDSAQSCAITATDEAPLVLDNERLYLRRYWCFEQQVAQHLLQRMQVHPLSAAQQMTADSLLAQLFDLSLIHI